MAQFETWKLIPLSLSNVRNCVVSGVFIESHGILQPALRFPTHSMVFNLRTFFLFKLSGIKQ